MSSEIKGQDNSEAVKRRRFARLIRARGLGYICLVSAAALFVLDIIGSVTPLRNADVYHDPRNLFTDDITLTAGEFWKRVPRKLDEAVPDYAKRMTETVAAGIAHLQVSDRSSLKKYHWEIPIWENYLIWASRHAIQVQRWLNNTLDKRGSAYQYQFSNYRRAVERGVGLCTTHCIVLIGVLKEQGIHTQLVGIGQHSVTRAEIAPGNWWVLDPDFGVALPYDLNALRENPGLIESYYAARGHSKEWIDTLKGFYVSPNPVIFNEVKDAQGHLRYYFSLCSYYLIWIIPIVMMITGFVILRRSKRTMSCLRQYKDDMPAIFECETVHSAG